MTSTQDDRPAHGVRSVAAGTVIAIALVAEIASASLARLGLHGISAVFIAIILGMAARAAAGEDGMRPRLVAAGEGIYQRALPIAIALLGLGIASVEIQGIGRRGALIAAVVVASSLATGLAASRRLPHAGRLPLLVATGMGICGNSAIAAVGPLLGARRRDVAVASATITVAGTVLLFAVPWVLSEAGVPPAIRGVVAGAIIPDTGQALAAGAAGGAQALAGATLTKMLRAALLVPVVAVLALRDGSSTAGAASGRLPSRVAAAVPSYLLWFIGLAALGFAGDAALAGHDWWRTLTTTTSRISSTAITVAMAGLGLTLDPAAWRGGGATAGVVAGACLAATCLVTGAVLHLG